MQRYIKSDYVEYPILSSEEIKNGSKLTIGRDWATVFKVDQHFNWFQKLMWKWCFGIKVEDYSEDFDYE